jgi:hypothetical protein
LLTQNGGQDWFADFSEALPNSPGETLREGTPIRNEIDWCVLNLLTELTSTLPAGRRLGCEGHSTGDVVGRMMMFGGGF